MKRLLSLITVLACMSLQVVHADGLDQLLEQVRSGTLEKSKTASSLEKRFKTAGAGKASMVNSLKTQRAELETKSDALKLSYQQNEEVLNGLRNQREVALGDMKELFGAVQQIAGEAQANFESSIVSAQFPSRDKALESILVKLNQSNDLLSAGDIESLWSELLNEMVQQGKVATFSAPVATASGAKEERQVTRVGVFNLVSVAELPRQPEGRFRSQASSLQQASPGNPVEFSVDPTKGTLLGASVEKPSILERVEQGGLVGKVIIAMGVVAIAVALFKIIVLMGVASSVNRQAKNTNKPSAKNPLGRVLKVFHDNPKADTEAIELKLSEAIMKETPKLNSWLMFLKIVSVVAPLMGLLGTVTGMIETFQSITLFGAGDPKLMAGGISQALVTTVLGLVVAIPTVLLHTAAASKAKRVQEILEEQTAGMVARQVERS